MLSRVKYSNSDLPKLIMPERAETEEFLMESNLIEGVKGKDALKDAKKAWEYVFIYGTVELQEYIDYKAVIHVHKLLMKRLDPLIAGKLRDVDIWIGGDHKKFINREILLYRMKNAIEMVSSSFNISNENKEYVTKSAHIAFEEVHPFEDGNGRVGRILYNWHRINLGLPLHIIHFGEEQKEYYKWFRTKEI